VHECENKRLADGSRLETKLAQLKVSRLTKGANPNRRRRGAKQKSPQFLEAQKGRRKARQVQQMLEKKKAKKTKKTKKAKKHRMIEQYMTVQAKAGIVSEKLKETVTDYANIGDRKVHAMVFSLVKAK
jgi:hypothetical protein